MSLITGFAIGALVMVVASAGMVAFALFLMKREKHRQKQVDHDDNRSNA